MIQIGLSRYCPYRMLLPVGTIILFLKKYFSHQIPSTKILTFSTSYFDIDRIDVSEKARDIATEEHTARWTNPEGYVQENTELLIPYRFAPDQFPDNDKDFIKNGVKL